MVTWRFGIAVGLLMGLGACSNMMGGGSSGSKSAMMTQPAMAPDMVKQVQSKLRDDGYYKQGAVDGVWGPGTQTAVQSFQKEHNLGSSGELDVPTLQALNVASVPAVVNNTVTTPAPDSAHPMGTQPTGIQTTGTQPGARQPMATSTNPAATDSTVAPAPR